MGYLKSFSVLLKLKVSTFNQITRPKFNRVEVPMVQGCCDGIASILICDSKRIAPTECLPSLSSQARWSIYDIDDVADK